MKRIAMAIALVYVLVGTSFAGDIPGVPAPPPPAAPTETDGDMGGGGFAQEITDEVVLAIFGMFTN